MTRLPSKNRRAKILSPFVRGGHTPYTYEQAVEAFWKKVDKSAGLAGCWIWLGAYRYDGYGHVQFQRKQSAAHQRAYLIAKGPMNGLWVLHSCDNRKCVNPAHLSLGTREQNMREASERKRVRGGWPKFDANAAKEVRAAFKTDDQGRSNAYALARQYGVHRNTIIRVVKNG